MHSLKLNRALGTDKRAGHLLEWAAGQLGAASRDVTKRVEARQKRRDKNDNALPRGASGRRLPALDDEMYGGRRLPTVRSR